MVCAAVWLAAVLGGCASVKSAAGSDGKTPVVRLKNGIPVYLHHDNSSLAAVSLYVRGGNCMLPVSQSGLGDALFSMMLQGSQDYSYETIQKLTHKMNARFSSAFGSMNGRVSLFCIDYYLDDLLPVLLDGFMHPVYNKQQYELLMKEYEQGIQTRKSDPGAILSKKILDNVYAGHPFNTSVQPTEDTLSYITPEHMEELRTTLLDSSRLFVVAGGSFNEKKLLALLERTIGLIAPAEKEFVMPDIPAVTVKDEQPVLCSHENSAGTGSYILVFSAPEYNSDDYTAALLAAEIYGDQLYNVVRQKYGACYTPGCNVVASLAPFGTTWMSRVSDFSGIAAYEAESRELMAAGKIVLRNDDDGGYVFGSVEDVLDGCKNSYITSSYFDKMTLSASVANIAANILLYDDPDMPDILLEKIKHVTGDDVRRVFNEYWVRRPSRWYVMTGPDDQSKVKL